MFGIVFWKFFSYLESYINDLHENWFVHNMRIVSLNCSCMALIESLLCQGPDRASGKWCIAYLFALKAKNELISFIVEICYAFELFSLAASLFIENNVQ